MGQVLLAENISCRNRAGFAPIRHPQISLETSREGPGGEWRKTLGATPLPDKDVYRGGCGGSGQERTNG